MATSASQARSRQSAYSGRPASSRRPLGVVAARRARPTGTRHWVVAIAAAVAVGSLLAVVGVRAYMTQGQVRLSRLQDEMSVQLDQNRSLQLRIAQLEQPGSVLSQAKRQGLVLPSHVIDVPEVSSSLSEVSTSPGSAGGSPPEATSRPSGPGRTVAASARSADR